MSIWEGSPPSLIPLVHAITITTKDGKDHVFFNIMKRHKVCIISIFNGLLTYLIYIDGTRYAFT